jgi:RNA polymerase sigma factor (sigma-70 family)
MEVCSGGRAKYNSRADRFTDFVAVGALNRLPTAVLWQIRRLFAQNIHTPVIDKKFVDGLRTGDPLMLDLIVQQNWPAVRRMVMSAGGTAAEAEDVLMDSLEVLLLKVRKADFELTAPFSFFLLAICRYKWLSVLKRKKMLAERVTDAEFATLYDQPDVQAQLEQQDRYRIYRKHWAAQGEACKQLLTLALEGRSITELMEILGFGSEGYTRKRKHQCREKLLRNIRNDPDFEAY